MVLTQIMIRVYKDSLTMWTKLNQNKYVPCGQSKGTVQCNTIIPSSLTYDLYVSTSTYK